MSNIQPKFGTPTELTITLAALASSTSQTVGRQGTIVDNSTTRYDLIHLFLKITAGTSPTTGKQIFIFGIRGDGMRRTDGAGATDAAFTRQTAQLLRTIRTDATSDKAYEADVQFPNPGPEWTIAIVHDTGVNLNATAGNHHVYWTGEHMEASA
jgi:hypothetical protein